MCFNGVFSTLECDDLVLKTTETIGWDKKLPRGGGEEFVSISSLSAGPYRQASGRGTVDFYFITESKLKVQRRQFMEAIS